MQRLPFAAVTAGLCVLLATASAARANTSGTDSPIAGSGDELLEPREAVGYRRGRALKLRVVTIGWADVEVNTARAFVVMRDAAARDGVELWIRNGFRTGEHQLWLYQAWRAGWGNPAARPGYSNHQSGRALDLSIRDPGTFAWLEANAKRFGFKRTVRGEPWHWEYVKKPRPAKTRLARARPRPRAAAR